MARIAPTDGGDSASAGTSDASGSGGGGSGSELADEIEATRREAMRRVEPEDSIAERDSASESDPMTDVGETNAVEQRQGAQRVGNGGEARAPGDGASGGSTIDDGSDGGAGGGGTGGGGGGIPPGVTGGAGAGVGGTIAGDGPTPGSTPSDPPEGEDTGGGIPPGTTGGAGAAVGGTVAGGGTPTRGAGGADGDSGMDGSEGQAGSPTEVGAGSGTGGADGQPAATQSPGAEDTVFIDVGDTRAEVPREFARGMQGSRFYVSPDRASRLKDQVDAANPAYDIEPGDVRVVRSTNDEGEDVLVPRIVGGVDTAPRTDMGSDALQQRRLAAVTLRQTAFAGPGTRRFTPEQDLQRSIDSPAEAEAYRQEALAANEISGANPAGQPGVETEPTQLSPEQADALQQRIAARQEAARISAEIQRMRPPQGADPELTGGYPAGIIESSVESENRGFDVEVEQTPGLDPEITVIDRPSGFSGPLGDEFTSARSGVFDFAGDVAPGAATELGEDIVLGARGLSQRARFGARDVGGQIATRAALPLAVTGALVSGAASLVPDPVTDVGSGLVSAAASPLIVTGSTAGTAVDAAEPAIDVGEDAALDAATPAVVTAGAASRGISASEPVTQPAAELGTAAATRAAVPLAVTGTIVSEGGARASLPLGVTAAAAGRGAEAFEARTGQDATDTAAALAAAGVAAPEPATSLTGAAYLGAAGAAGLTAGALTAGDLSNPTASQNGELPVQPPIQDQPELQPGEPVQDQPELEPGDTIQDRPELQPGEPVQDQPELEPGDTIQDRPELLLAASGPVSTGQGEAELATGGSAVAGELLLDPEEAAPEGMTGEEFLRHRVSRYRIPSIDELDDIPDRETSEESGTQTIGRAEGRAVEESPLEVFQPATFESEAELDATIEAEARERLPPESAFESEAAFEQELEAMEGRIREEVDDLLLETVQQQEVAVEGEQGLTQGELVDQTQLVAQRQEQVQELDQEQSLDQEAEQLLAQDQLLQEEAALDQDLLLDQRLDQDLLLAQEQELDQDLLLDQQEVQDQQLMEDQALDLDLQLDQATQLQGAQITEPDYPGQPTVEEPGYEYPNPFEPEYPDVTQPEYDVPQDTSSRRPRIERQADEDNEFGSLLGMGSSRQFERELADPLVGTEDVGESGLGDTDGNPFGDIL